MKKKKAAKIIGVILVVVFVFGGGFAAGTISTIVKTNSSDNIASQVQTKMNYLNKLIDNYYLDYNDNKDDEKIKDSIYKGLLNGLDDPYSVYYTKEEYQSLLESTSGSYCGIGVVVSQNSDTGVITAVRVFDGAPGDKAGVKAQDIIYKVEDEEVTGEDLSSVVAKMKGDKGTKVKVTVYRPSTSKYIDMEIERDEVDVPTIETKMLDNNIGYMQITEFDEVTYNQFKEGLESLKKQGMKSIIFDVRDNPGGMYKTVVNMLDDILPEGVLVYTEDKEGKKEEQKSDADCLDMPMVVLQNENSASAAEIFAGAIKAFKAGTIIGNTSFGKGIVQTIMPLSDGSAIKLTIQRYFTPSGVNIQGTGIEPDIKVEENSETERDDQLQKAIDTLSEE